MGNTKSKEEEEKPLNLQIKVEKLQSLTKEGIITNTWTRIALKNPTSFLIASHNSGLRLFENNKELYSGIGNQNLICRNFFFIAFIPSQNCYLFTGTNYIYRKDINSEHPYKWFKIDQARFWRPCLVYSKIYNKIILLKSKYHKKSFAVLSPKIKKLESSFGDSLPEIYRLEIMRKDEKKILAVTFDGILLIFKIGFGILLKKKILEPKLGELVKYFDISPDDKFLCVEVVNSKKKAMRLYLFDIENEIELKSTFDCKRVDYRYGFACHGYVGKSLVFLGLSLDNRSQSDKFDACLIEYNLDSEEVKEHIDKRVDQQSICPIRLHFMPDGWYYYVGKNGTFAKLMVCSEEGGSKEDNSDSFLCPFNFK